jgi:hypothetical protein
VSNTDSSFAAPAYVDEEEEGKAEDDANRALRVKEWAERWGRASCKILFRRLAMPWIEMLYLKGDVLRYFQIVEMSDVSS